MARARKVSRRINTYYITCLVADLTTAQVNQKQYIFTGMLQSKAAAQRAIEKTGNLLSTERIVEVQDMQCQRVLYEMSESLFLEYATPVNQNG